MKIICGMATFKGRNPHDAIKSLLPQVDEFFLYDNELQPDITDLGKFFQLHKITEPCYFFSVDDDLLYPPNYVQNTIHAIEKHGCIISHHGRQLLGKDRLYYTGHKSFRCLDEQPVTTHLHVAGTGVTAFRTDYFHPTDLHTRPNRRMSDLIFSLEAAKQGKRIMTVPHRKGWIKQLEIDHSTSCHTIMREDQTELIAIANEIFDIFNPKSE